MGGVEWGLGSGDLVLVDSSLGGVEGGEYLLCWAWCGPAESMRWGRVVSLGVGWGRKLGLGRFEEDTVVCLRVEVLMEGVCSDHVLAVGCAL